MAKEIIALDSCVIIDAIQKEPARYPSIEPIIRKAEANELIILVSTASIAEVMYCKELVAKGLTQEQQDDLIGKWFETSYLIKRAADFGVCTKAAQLGRLHNTTPLDSIILATAVLNEADTLVTYDGENSGIGLLGLDGRIEGGLRIMLPEKCLNQSEIVYEHKETE